MVLTDITLPCIHPLPYGMTSDEELLQFLSTHYSTLLQTDHLRFMFDGKQVVHNPGTPPEGPLSEFGSPDLVCVSEEPHPRYINPEVQVRIGTYSLPHDKTLFQVSGVPLGAVEGVTKGILSRPNKPNGPRSARYIFVTDLDKDFYESFGESWGRFIKAVAEVIEEEEKGKGKRKK